MKRKLFLKSAVAITALLLHFNVSAQDIPPITLHVETAGTLSSFIGETRGLQITDLTLTGNLNGTDIRFIREMAGRRADGGSLNYEYGARTNGKLANLNLAEVTIVSGGDYYHSYPFFYYSHNNEISSRMFFGCDKLKTVILPNSVTSIGTGAFEGCTGLTSVTIPNSVTEIGYGIFQYCTSLTSITIPNITLIQNNAFLGCTGLKSVTIPNSVTSIGNGVFWGCTGLTSIAIPNSVTSIGDGVFEGCTGLKEFIVSEQNTKYSSMDGVLFNKDKTTLLQFPIAKSNKTYTIPNSVTSIGYCAFQGCTGLTGVTIPNSVTSIRYVAFSGCTGLTSITIGNSVTSIGYAAFSGCIGLTEIHSQNPTPPRLDPDCFKKVNTTTCKLYVPNGTYYAYWLAWGFDNIIEEGTSAVQTVTNKYLIQSASNGIRIDTQEEITVSVYNLSGQAVYQNVIQLGTVEIPLQQGTYVLRVGNESQKIIVK